MPRDQKIARGMFLIGLRTSPAEAAIAEKPKKVIKTNPAVEPIFIKS